MEKSMAVVIETMNTNSFLINKALDGLSEEHFSERPNASTNPIHYLLGHLTLYRFQACKLLSEDNSYKFEEQYKSGIENQDRAKYPTTEEIKAEWNKISEKFKTLIENAAPEQLAAEIPKKYPIGEQNRLGALQFLMYHEAYHIGQISLVRKFFGY